jgi:NADPH:quinone reductase-like Zn-dependent oxidoreductase
MDKPRPSNHAAYLIDKNGSPLEVREAPYTRPGPGQMVVKTGAMAMNPVDFGMQHVGRLAFTWIRCPAIVGNDVAGEVVEVGAGGTASSLFKVGDRVLGLAAGGDPDVHDSSEGGFQEYAVLRDNLTSRIPDSMSYEQACVIPVGLSTAACGLFQKDFLGLQHPRLDAEPTGETLLVWGGSTSVGSNAVQLATAAGYDVIATASPSNFDYVRGLGASHVLDYHDAAIVAKLTAAFEGRLCAGAIAIGATSLEPCIDVVARAATKRHRRRFVAQASMPLSLADISSGLLGTARTIVGFVWWSATVAVRKRWRRVGSSFIFGSSLMHNEVGAAVFTDFLPAALARGSYRAVPEPVVVGQGLGAVQGALDVLQKGVSASKIVVSM